MKKITIYTTSICPYCVRAKALFDRKGLTYEEINVEEQQERDKMVIKAGGRRTDVDFIHKSKDDLSFDFRDLNSYVSTIDDQLLVSGETGLLDEECKEEFLI